MSATATITPVITPSRTSGTAPLAVFFDGLSTTGLAESAYLKQRYPVLTGTAGLQARFPYLNDWGDYVNANFFWNFDATDTDPSGGARELSKGFVNAYVFETPGTYTVAMDVYDITGQHARATTTITVYPFGGTTYYCAATGSDLSTGTSTATPFQTFSKLMSVAGPNTQLLLRNGDEFFIDPGYTATCSGPVIVSGYSDPAKPSAVKPILKWIGRGGGRVINLTKTANDWRWVGLHLKGTGTKRNFDSGGMTIGGTNNLVLRSKFERLGTDAFDTNKPRGAFIVDCDMNNYGPLGVFSDDADRLAIVGNSFTEINGPPEHVVRVAGGDRTFIAYNYMTTEQCKTAIQIRGSQFTPYNSNSVILDNDCDGLVGVQPTNDTAAAILECHLLEGNYSVYDPTVPYNLDVALNIEAGHQVVLRNNICGDFHQPISILAHPTSGAASYVYAYNNTAIYTSSGTGSDLWSKMISGSGFAGVFVKNNLQYVEHALPTASSLISLSGPSVETCVYKAGGAGQNELQRIRLIIPEQTMQGGSNTFTLSYSGQTTAPIAWNANASAVKDALAALSNIGTGNINVTADPAGYWTAEFSGTLAQTDVPTISGNASNIAVSGTNLTSDNNLFYAPDYSASWSIYSINRVAMTLTQAQAAGYDTHSITGNSITGNPNLLSLDPASPDFCRIPFDSNARDAGATVPVFSDYQSYGRPYGGAYDIGAAEWTLLSEVLVDDTFLGSGTSAAASGYYAALATSTELSVVSSGTGTERLYALFTGNNNTGSGPIKSFEGRTLTNEGDKIVLSFVIQAENDWVAANTSDYLRFGLLDYTGTVTGNLGTNGANHSGAYFGAIATGSGTNGIWKSAQTTNASSVFYNNTSPNFTTKLKDDTTIPTLGNTNDTNSYQMSISIEKVAGGVQISITKAGTSVSWTDTSSPFYTFDALAIVVPRNSAGNDFYLDNVEVVFWPAQ